jgi:hypothetical protein
MPLQKRLLQSNQFLLLGLHLPLLSSRPLFQARLQQEAFHQKQEWVWRQRHQHQISKQFYLPSVVVARHRDE